MPVQSNVVNFLSYQTQNRNFSSKNKSSTKLNANPSISGDQNIELKDSFMDVSIEAIETGKAARPMGPYSQAIKVTGGTTVYVSGCIALDTEGKLMGGGNVVEETK